jgi:hypothetical protein
LEEELDKDAVCCRLYSTCKVNTFEARKSFKIQGKVIGNAKYADDLVLLAKEEAMLQDMTERRNEIGRCSEWK